MIKNRIGLLAFAFLIVLHTFAQNNKLKLANRNFDNISYIEAIRNYEDYLRSAKKGTPEVKEALTRLAYSYRKVQDSRNAELTYAQLLEAYGSDVESEIYLYYAQAL